MTTHATPSPAAIPAEARAEHDPIRALLVEARDKGLIYWEPNTTRGAVAKADMLGRIDVALARAPAAGADHAIFGPHRHMDEIDAAREAFAWLEATAMRLPRIPNEQIRTEREDFGVRVYWRENKPHAVMLTIRDGLNFTFGMGFDLSKLAAAPAAAPAGDAVEIDYTNHRGERSTRAVIPTGRILPGDDTYHPGARWVIEAWDVAKGAMQTFDPAHVHAWGGHAARPDPAQPAGLAAVAALIQNALDAAANAEQARLRPTAHHDYTPIRKAAEKARNDAHDKALDAVRALLAPAAGVGRLISNLSASGEALGLVSERGDEAKRLQFEATRKDDIARLTAAFVAKDREIAALTEQRDEARGYSDRLKETVDGLLAAAGYVHIADARPSSDAAPYPEQDDDPFDFIRRMRERLDEVDAALRRDPGAGVGDLTDAARDVLIERRDQIEQCGFTAEHDEAQEAEGQMAGAAACYAFGDRLWTGQENGIGFLRKAATVWPWPAHWWKPTTRRRNLVKAGALVLAEIERLDRAEARSRIEAEGRPGRAGGEGA